ncbi:copper transport protein ctr1 [Actinomortierella ambigua]|nr:copper transport protein ctr1 [Actinomortierella ambigua]
MLTSIFTGGSKPKQNYVTSLVVRNPIGAGAYGCVYHASWKGRTAALKKLFVVQEEARQSDAIQREIEILEKLRYRHIIQFYGADYHEGMLVLIMDYAEGGSLKQAIDGRRVTDWPTKNRIAQEIVRGLAYIHHEGVIHRDLKSMNVLFTRYMEVKLCDFGIATLKSRSATSSAKLKGTIRWMAPELFARTPKYSTKSDMYALGVVMWEMAAECTMPFKDQHNNAMVIRLVESGERDDLPKETPDDYRQWVERCWDQDPSKRPEAGEMVVEDDVPDHADKAEADVSKLSGTSVVQGLSTILSFGYNAVATRVKSGQLPENVKALLARANEDDVEALVELASIYENGSGVKQDDSMAFKWYLRAAELRSPLAQAKTGDNFYHGRGTPKDFVPAAYWMRQAADQGNANAQNNLGGMYRDGQGLAQNYTEALLWFRKSAEQGNANAQNNLGWMYEKGHGVAQDYAQALWWYRKSAEQGNATAQCKLGLMYENGRGVAKDYAEAVSWYLKSAEQGNAEAQHELAGMYFHGNGVAQDYALALLWLRKSAEQGKAEGQLGLGWMYQKGHGVAQDYTQALSWYRKSAEQGDAEAQHQLGVMYHDGQGVPQDYAQALSWYRKSVEQGNSSAQYGLGLMYYEGRGVTRLCPSAVVVSQVG